MSEYNLKKHARFGKRIRNLKQLDQAAILKQSVIGIRNVSFGKPSPARWVLQWQGPQLLRAFEIGLYVYKKKPKKKAKKS